MAQGLAFLRFVTANEALLDAILYDWYPDKLPGEMDDSLDILRFWRMIEAKSIISAEDERKRFLDGSQKPPKPGDGARWQQHKRHAAKWAEHDELLKEFGLWDD